MAAAAVSFFSLPTVCSSSTVLSQTSRGFDSSSACSRFLASVDSGPVLRHNVSPSSERAYPIWDSGRCELSSRVFSMASPNRDRRTAAVAQGSTTVREVESHELLPKTYSALTVTCLEVNSWLWEILGLKILVDPVLVGNFDFGIAKLYDGAKLVHKNFKLEDLPELDYLLITQGYDDHCHEKILGPLSCLNPRLPVISTPNAQKILRKYFQNVTYLEPTAERITLKASNGTDVVIRASPGPILGPPWQRPENGYFTEVKNPKFTIYHEPHCLPENPNLDQERAERGEESALRSGRRAFSTMCLLGLAAFPFTGEVRAEETEAKPKKKKGKPPSSPYDEDRLLEQNRRMQKLNNAPTEFPGFVREGFQVKVVVSDKYVTSKSGLIYYDMVVGEGVLPKDGQQVIFHYTGYNESGRRVDSSYQQGQPARTRLGIQGMIPGFEEGIKSMRPGGRRIIIVPPELGPPVGPSTFFSAKQFEVFDVELLESKDCSRRTLLFYSDVVCD